MSRAVLDFSEFPRTVPVGGSSPQNYHLDDSYFAVHGQHSSAQAAPSLEFVPENIAVYPIDHLSQIGQAPPQTGPVYTLGKGGSIAVPTGRIFVRLASGSRFEDHATDFRNAGYEIDQTISYAPSAGWVRSLSHSIASSLARLDRLHTIPGVENVEPQMLSKAVRKG
jgi:hypothetical protein